MKLDTAQLIYDHDDSFDPYDFVKIMVIVSQLFQWNVADDYYKARHNEARDHVFMNIESTFEQDPFCTRFLNSFEGY